MYICVTKSNDGDQDLFLTFDDLYEPGIATLKRDAIPFKDKKSARNFLAWRVNEVLADRHWEIREK